jgi:hypothetical protein
MVQNVICATEIGLVILQFLRVQRSCIAIQLGTSNAILLKKIGFGMHSDPKFCQRAGGVVILML